MEKKRIPHRGSGRNSARHAPPDGQASTRGRTSRLAAEVALRSDTAKRVLFAELLALNLYVTYLNFKPLLPGIAWAMGV